VAVFVQLRSLIEVPKMWLAIITYLSLLPARREQGVKVCKGALMSQSVTGTWLILEPYMTLIPFVAVEHILVSSLERVNLVLMLRASCRRRCGHFLS
jgi:hypothetical protein